MKGYIVAGILFTALFQVGSAIKCYTCSQQNPGNKDPGEGCYRGFDSVAPTQCTNAVMDRCYIKKVTATNSLHTSSINRHCSTASACNSLPAPVKENALTVEESCCSTDGCNSAGHCKISVAVLLASVLSVIFKIYA